MPHSKHNPRPIEQFDVRALQSLNQLFSRIYHDLEVLRPCPIPASGPAILVCNHISGLDPALIQSTSPRVVTWMMAKEFYDLGALHWMFKRLRAIPVGRGGRDMAAMRSALRALESGGVLGIFPEGRIEKDHTLMPFQTGVALMACRTGTSVYPAYLDGSNRNMPSMFDAYLRRHRATITFGEPIAFEKCDPEREHLEAATQKIQESVQRLKEEVDARR